MGKNVDSRVRTFVRFQIEQLDNETFLATLVAHSNGSMLHGEKPYDDQGALYYVVAVVFIYGFSIILMIGSLIKRNKNDNGVSKYMKDMDKVRRMERRQLKYQTRLAMSAAGGSRRASRALAAASRGFHLPETTPVPMSAPAATLTESAFNWDATSAEQHLGGDLFNTASSGSLTSNPTENSSPRIPLLGRPPPGKAVPVSPWLGRTSRHESVTTVESTENDDVFSELCDNTDLDSREPSMTFLPVTAPVDGGSRRTVGLKPVIVCERQTSGEINGSSNSSTTCVANDTILYMDSDEKCKVSLTQHMSLSPQVSLSPSIQLGTVHEVEEEQVGSKEITDKVYVV